MGDVKIELGQYHKIIVRKLLKVPILTEFELSNEICMATNQPHDAVDHQIPKLFTKLKEAGLVWTGPLFCSTSQRPIWAAALTMEGRKYAKSLAGRNDESES